MRKQEEILLDEYTYRVTQLPFKKARSLARRISPVLMEGDGNLFLYVTKLEEDELDSLEALVLGENCHWKNDQKDWVPITPSFVEAHFDDEAGVGRYYQLLVSCITVHTAAFMKGLDLKAVDRLQESLQ